MRRSSGRTDPWPCACAIFSASSASIVSAPFRRGETMSPMPRMRPATRPGWNGSSASIFSPVPTKLDRLAGDRAHRQRRAAARIAVHAGQHDAGQPTCRRSSRDVDRVLAGQRIDDQQGFARRRDRAHRLHLVHQLLSTCSGPRYRASARHSRLSLPPAWARRAISTGGWPAGWAACHADLLAQHRNCSCAAGRRVSSDAISTFLPCFSFSAWRAWRWWWSCPSPAGRPS
jgi:hypothetical protein